MPTPPKKTTAKTKATATKTTSTTRKSKDTPEKKNGGNSGRQTAKPDAAKAQSVAKRDAAKPIVESVEPSSSGEPLDFTEDELLPSDEPVVEVEEPQPWDILPTEPHRWHIAFQRFKAAGPARSLLNTYNAILAEKGREKQVRVSGAWHEVAKKYQWHERAKAWDRYQSQKDEADYEQRLRDNRDRALNVAEQMTSRAETMLNFPLVKQRVEETYTHSDGTKIPIITIVEPANWNFNTPARLMGSAERVLRLAHDIETRRLLEQIQSMDDSEIEEEFGSDSAEASSPI